MNPDPNAFVEYATGMSGRFAELMTPKVPSKEDVLTARTALRAFAIFVSERGYLSEELEHIYPWSFQTHICYLQYRSWKITLNRPFPHQPF